MNKEIEEALERNKPKKVKTANRPELFAGRCPNCMRLIWREDGYPNFCSDCGQALDWKTND